MITSEETKEALFKIARNPIAGKLVRIAFKHFSELIPVDKIPSVDNVVVFVHPRPFWTEHLLLVPKEDTNNFLDINFKDRSQSANVLQVFIEAQGLIGTKAFQAPSDEFSLMVNGGNY